MVRVARVARLVTTSALAFAIVVAASGWLYLVHGGHKAAEPRLADALPLDELSGHAAAPLALFLAVWLSAAVLLGVIARLVKADRLTAALLLALGVGTWSYLQTAVSILVVRQIAAEDALRAAAGVHAVYMPAALAGLAGSLGGVAPRPVRSRAPFILAAFVAVAGLLAVLDGISPNTGAR